MGVALLWTGSPALAQSETIKVKIKLLTGGRLEGLVVDHNESAVVVFQNGIPYVFAWSELDPPSAFTAKKELLKLARGGADRLTAADHFDLGLYAISRERIPAAQNEFRQAQKLDPSYGERAREVFTALRKSRAQNAAGQPKEPESEVPPALNKARPGLSDLIPTTASGGHDGAARSETAREELREAVDQVYRAFGQAVQEEMGGDVKLRETDHFLIWTDWPPRVSSRLDRWAEDMYAALCATFGFDLEQDVFLAKCPVFCWRSKGRFRKFAKLFDGHDGTDAIGYTRSIEETGHVHMALYLPGQSAESYDQFATTLVHEGTHAFVHRFHSTRLIPHWVNEGFAELIAERVLGEKCFNGEKADLLAAQYAKYENWSIGDLLTHTGPIEVQEYALAHSIVEYLESQSRPQFAGFLRSLKDGATIETALSENFDGLTPARLEADWRSSIKSKLHPLRP